MHVMMPSMPGIEADSHPKIHNARFGMDEFAFEFIRAE